MALRLIEARADEPVTVAEAKAHLRVEHDDDDTYIAGLIKAARAMVERETNRTLIVGTYELTLDSFYDPRVCRPSGEISLQRGPILNVESVKYDDPDGDEQTLDAARYYVDAVSEPGWIVPTREGWESTLDGINAVRIRFTAGYEPTTDSPPDPAGNVPDDAMHAIKMLVSLWYENREPVASVEMKAIPRSVDALIDGLKIYL